jgi:hypothetical protein
MSITPLCRNCEIETRKHCDECGGYGSDDDSVKVDYVFDCTHCGIHIVRNSEEHDECTTKDGDNWFCEKCHKFCEEDNTLRKVDYVFDCTHCGIHIELNSEEHDNCVTNDGDNWFCEKCHKFCEDENGEKFD